MSERIAFTSTQVSVKPMAVESGHLDLSPHFTQPIKPDFQQQVIGNQQTQRVQSWTPAQTDTQRQNTSILNAHLKAVGDVIRHRKEDARAALTQNAALASYALPIDLLVGENHLPPWLQNARNDLHTSMAQTADLVRHVAKEQFSTLGRISMTTRIGWPVLLEQTHPIIAQNIIKLGNTVVEHGRARIEDLKRNLTNTPKITPALTAATVDALLGLALLGVTKKVSAPHIRLDIEKRGIQGKTVHQVKGTQTRLTLQAEPKGDRIYFNLRDLAVSINPEKSTTALALLTQTLQENKGMVKLVSIHLRGTTGAQRKELLAAHGKPISDGPLKDMPLGKLLSEEGYTGKIKVLPKTATTKDKRTVTYLEVMFTRS